MLRFTLAMPYDMQPGDLTIDAECVVSVVEREQDGRKLADIHMWNQTYWIVNDPQRDVAERIARARGEFGEMPRL